MTNENSGISSFLKNKSAHSIALFEGLLGSFQEIGDVNLHAAKTMISISNRVNFAYVIQIGKDFIDVVLPFKQGYEDNYCFRKIKKVPAGDDYNHHLRVYQLEDLNEEVRTFLKMAYENGR